MNTKHKEIIFQVKSITEPSQVMLESKGAADDMWPYVSKLTFKWNVPVETGPGTGGIASHIAYYNGVEVDSYEVGWGTLL